MNLLLIFIGISIGILLSYHIIILLFFPKKGSYITLQKIILGIIFLTMIFYYWNITSITIEQFVLPWIWGFLTGHLFFKHKKRWLHELFGLGFLLAITIILFSKQEIILKYLIPKQFQNNYLLICFCYMFLGLAFGMIFWKQQKND